jgi:glycosyltransferase involved in cell wall biosynthesis
MRILYIDHYAGSPQYGMEYRPHYMARQWVRMGHEVTVMAASFSHLRYKNPDVTAELSEEMIDGIRYVWLKTPSYSGNGMYRVINMATFSLKLFRFRRRIIRQFRPDAVIASSTYTWDIFPSHAIARAANAKLIYEVHDLWPLSPIELGNMPRWHPFIVSLQWGEDYACRHADLVVSMLPLANMHLSEHGMSAEKFHYIPNGIELSEWESETDTLPDVHLEVLKKCRQQGRFLLCYAGSHGLSDALDILLDAAKLLRDRPVDFVLVGKGPDKIRLQQKVMQWGLHNVHFLDPVPKKAIPNLLRSMDGLYIGCQKQQLYRFGISPNKLMDYMAAGKPIINAIEAGNDPIGDANCGFTVKAESTGAIASAVIRLMALPATERERMGTAGKAYVRTRHDYAILAQKFLGLMARRN